MTSALLELSRLVRPPTAPSSRPTPETWAYCRRELHLEFPQDYRQFLEIYGEGTLGHGMYVLSPYRGHYLTMLRSQAEIFAGLRVEGVEPYASTICYPEDGGVLLWASSDAGDDFCWQTGSPDPDSWPIVVFPRNDFVALTYDMSMTEYLASLLAGRVEDPTSQIVSLGPPFEYRPVDETSGDSTILR